MASELDGLSGSARIAGAMTTRTWLMIGRHERCRSARNADGLRRDSTTPTMKSNNDSLAESMGLRRERAWNVYLGASAVFLLAAAIALAGSILL
jgi:hypothetical protein